MRVRAALVTLLAATLVAAGCTDASPGSGPEPETQTEIGPTPEPFRAADPRLPDGYQRAQCSDLRSRDNSGLAVRFAVPPEYADYERDGRWCTFVVELDRDFTVTFGRLPSLASVKETEVDPYIEPGQGDGQLGRVSYDADVPVFGDRRGERLEYWCYCDGQELHHQVVQADGVQVRWTTPEGRPTRTRMLHTVTGSLALVRDDRSTCRAHGRTATFRPPIPQTESLDPFGGSCHLYLQPGRNSLQRYAEVVPAPRRSIEQIAASLGRLKRVHGIRIERGVAELDGQRADRLTWRFTREQVSLYNDPAGTWRMVMLANPDLQVTWGARPHQWRQEADVVRRFVDSVHLLPDRRDQRISRRRP